MKQTLSILAIGMVLFVGCRKNEPETFYGPDLNDLFGPFSIVQTITLSHNPINFALDGNLSFNGELSKNTDWVITITGANSGAIRNITGSERILSSANAAWNGGANSYPAFSIEDAYIEIAFPNEEGSPVLYDTVAITGEKIDDGVLITGFENGAGSNWVVFNQTTVTGEIVCGNGESAKGTCHYSVEGVVGWDWAKGSVAIQPDAGTFPLQSSPNNLFFNMALKPVESVGPTSSFIQIWFDEDENDDGLFDPNTEDRYIYEYWTTDTIWELVSVEYASLTQDENGDPSVTNGNGLPEPSKLLSVNIFFLSDPNNGNAKALFDHIIFTSNGSYNP